ncbi:MAG TPA: class I SAM-dependent methyltransferase [Thermoplasmata archaeon]|nr:class I SAM-dependent methyltransferase [Thermoplasmata archaeon]
MRSFVSTPTNWWEDVYRSSDVADLPWYTPNLDSDLERALKEHLVSGARVLDIGTGPATQAIALTKRGYEVVATDIAPSAIAKARHAASREAVRIDFRVDNILASKLQDALVDAIVDRGVFHTLAPDARPTYVAAVHRVLRPAGLLFLKTFSDKEPGSYGPHRISAQELRDAFRSRFTVESIVDAAFQGTLRPSPKAWFATMRRR